MYGAGRDARVTSRYVMLDLPVMLPSIKQKMDDVQSTLGVSICEWSCDSRFIATKTDENPCALYIWDVTLLSLSAVLIQDTPIRSAKWSPKTLMLAFCTGTPRLFLWSIEGASICDIPLEDHEFNVQRVKWNPDGRDLALFDRGKMLIAYP
jgi:WD40 repeat protein